MHQFSHRKLSLISTYLYTDGFWVYCRTFQRLIVSHALNTLSVCLYSLKEQRTLHHHLYELKISQDDFITV